MSYTIVWFKRDLRVHDHAPLVHAARRGKVLCLYVIEPSLWAQPDAASQHYLFIQECLHDLAQQLRACGARLQVAVGEVTEVFGRLHAAAAFSHLVSHEETGNGHTFARDKAVARWCLDHGVTWREWPQHGVVRRLPMRDVWHDRWAEHMYAPCVPAPGVGALSDVMLPWPAMDWPGCEALGLDTHAPPRRQRGGRARGSEVLRDFLFERSRNYRGGISSPLTAPSACSRLSPYLAYGCLGMREVVQATEQRVLQLRASTDEDAVWQRKGLAAFVSRLHWHCHFIQKLESEPAIEFRNLHRGYDGLREDAWNATHFAALVAGRTGWPMVDACVAMLRETGWINFRMRAMLVSVASYPLWLHWRPVGVWLARQFIDYEPGIHWSQMQMQAGTTGINTTRVYNPIKQAQDQDPHGRFVRRWLPALRRVPDAWLLQPWRMPPDVQARCGVRVGEDIPVPLVDLVAATRQAKMRVHALRARPEVHVANEAIVKRHASRLRRDRVSNPRENASAHSQLSLDF
ncbi:MULTISPECIES: cryptochrome/deoxyribodipyrimidine photo-lyase family protein [Ralstonia]|jgi:deoxyribodipyrimidine photo-lyase|uniref:Cryptochrome-like protein cry2 n=1 Tax=Ralstonia thomasii TaxID=3058596 RepID=A0AAD2BKS1_9RALS|nr:MULTISPECIES: FAD-binding domain-containing protein [Ralstonia]MBB0026361.1 deoxyribodipyrimidine photolyase [Ralstonia pickettii]MBB0037121.1 deoxyribodipyrimidine photolyase [Ralstonia pickettii]MBB0099689.1 deoxyribodipyrimidine photolyase [Ralstonia pickettii]MBB0109456.1 deoxyribodipyrimidine photolyase [Ralstonia pickettii]MBB0130435.1 deoxyribodipyrimidine photolyase [Ralstonia pickettii]